MSCCKSSKELEKNVIRVISILFLFSSLWDIYLAVSGHAALAIGTIWNLIIAGLGFCGAQNENVCTLRVFGVNVIAILAVTIILAIYGLLLLTGVIGDSRDLPFKVRAGHIAGFVIVIGFTIIFHVLAIVTSFSLANLIRQEKKTVSA